MAEWIYEAGIGENRAALIADGRIVEALIEVEGQALRAGAIVAARLRAGRIAEAKGEEILLDTRPTGVSEGGAIQVVVTREALAEPGKPKRAKGAAVASDTPLRPAPSLHARIGLTGFPVAEAGRHDIDRLEDAGWADLLEEAGTGSIAFATCALQISLTPAMTLIDVDGDAPCDQLVIEGAQAAGQAIRRLGITGSIGIDFPTSDNRALRQRAAETVRKAVHHPHEATAINGFGFMQLIRPRERSSILELIQYDRAGAAARSLIRHVERSGLIGAATITAHPVVIAAMMPDWLTRLSAMIGGAITLKSDPSLAMSAGHVSKS